MASGMMNCCLFSIAPRTRMRALSRSRVADRATSHRVPFACTTRISPSILLAITSVPGLPRTEGESKITRSYRSLSFCTSRRKFCGLENCYRVPLGQSCLQEIVLLRDHLSHGVLDRRLPRNHIDQPLLLLHLELVMKNGISQVSVDENHAPRASLRRRPTQS